MNLGRSWLVPALSILLAALASACVGPDTDADPGVIAEPGAGPAVGEGDAERAMAVAQMRERAEGGGDLPYPDVFQREQMLRLASRPEPRGLSTVEALEAELAEIGRRQAAAVSDAELAALQARAAELRRLADQARARARQ